jgi:hypothetical protein
LKTKFEAQVAHSVALTQSRHLVGQFVHDPEAVLNLPDPQLFDSAHLLLIRDNPDAQAVQ